MFFFICVIPACTALPWAVLFTTGGSDIYTRTFHQTLSQALTLQLTKEKTTTSSPHHLCYSFFSNPAARRPLKPFCFLLCRGR